MANLLASQRRSMILESLQNEGAVRVSQLATSLSVAEETIRRDLRQLDREGILTRTHGGAVRLQVPTPQATVEDSFYRRQQICVNEKRAIARHAGQQVQPGTVIALDASTSAWALLQEIINIPNLTVVTNSHQIVTMLAKREDIEVICLGGRYDVKMQMFIGILADEALKRLHIDVAFVSCGGIDVHKGFCDPSETAAGFKHRLRTVSERYIVLADSTKFSRRTKVLFAGPGDVDEIITDAAVDDAQLELLRKTGVQCTVVPT
jgi:DeoR/GlpR family transcriptional regulator of sugar metabolism